MICFPCRLPAMEWFSTNALGDTCYCRSLADEGFYSGGDMEMDRGFDNDVYKPLLAPEMAKKAP